MPLYEMTENDVEGLRGRRLRVESIATIHRVLKQGEVIQAPVELALDWCHLTPVTIRKSERGCQIGCPAPVFERL